MAGYDMKTYEETAISGMFLQVRAFAGAGSFQFSTQKKNQPATLPGVSGEGSVVAISGAI
jgi:hypothetical protein